MMNEKLVHQNLMRIVTIDESKDGFSRAVYDYNSHITLSEAILDDLIFSKIGQHKQLSPNNLRMFTSQVVAGLKKLHNYGFYHGNLKLETTHFKSTKNNVGGVVRLGGFQHNLNGAKGDWSSLGDLLIDLSKLMAINYSNLYELKCLCIFLKDSNVALHNIVMSILGHPAFLSLEDRPLFIIEIVNYLEYKDTEKVRPTDEHLKIATTKTSVLKGDSLENYQISESGQSSELWKHIKDLKAIRNPSKNYSDCFRMGIIVRALLSHHKENMNHPISNIIGQTMLDIDNYFRTVQPNLVIALYISANVHGFVFSKYAGRVPFDDDLLS